MISYKNCVKNYVVFYGYKMNFNIFRILLLENSGFVDKQIIKDQSKRKSAYAHISRKDIEDVVSKLSYPDWLVLFYLSQSMEKGNFGELLTRIASDIREENEED